MQSDELRIRAAGLKARDNVIDWLSGDGSPDHDLADKLESIIDACVTAALAEQTQQGVEPAPCVHVRGYAAGMEDAAQIAEGYDQTDTLTAPKAIASAIRSASMSAAIAEPYNTVNDDLDDCFRHHVKTTIGWLAFGSRPSPEMQMYEEGFKAGYRRCQSDNEPELGEEDDDSEAGVSLKEAWNRRAALAEQTQQGVEECRQALERIANASVRAWNVETATEALNTARAIAATALDNLVHVPAVEPEPVAWQHRTKQADTQWSEWRSGKANYSGAWGIICEERPLYSHPPRSPLDGSAPGTKGGEA